MEQHFQFLVLVALDVVGIKVAVGVAGDIYAAQVLQLVRQLTDPKVFQDPLNKEQQPKDI